MRDIGEVPFGFKYEPRRCATIGQPSRQITARSTTRAYPAYDHWMENGGSELAELASVAPSP